MRMLSLRRFRVFLFTALGLIIPQCQDALGAEPWRLSRCLEYAESNSPDAVLAARRIDAARAGLEQADSAFWPQLSLQSSYIRTNNPVTVFGSILNQRSFTQTLNFNDVPDLDNLNMKGLLVVPLYAGGRNLAGHDSAKAMDKAARKDAEAVKNTLAFEVTRAFYTVQKSREYIKAAEAALRSFKNSHAIADKRLAQGSILKAEVLDVEVRLAQAEEDLIRAENAKALAERALRGLLGLEEEDFSTAEEDPRLEAPPLDTPLSRPELDGVKQIQTAAAAKVREARAGHLPRVSAFGSVDYDRGWETDGDGTSYTAGAMAQWQLWDGFLTSGRTHEAVAALESAREQERKLSIGIRLERDQANLNLREARKRVAVTLKAITQAKESAELTRVRFEQGLVLATQLIDAETALTAAKVRNAEAKADERIAVAALRKAIGLPILINGGPN
jgi:outer membrane protein TolC